MQGILKKVCSFSGIHNIFVPKKVDYFSKKRKTYTITFLF